MANTTNKKTLMQLLVEYLSETNPLLLLLHLFYIIIVCITLSISYVVAFHWTTVVQIYTDAHDISKFGSRLKISVESDNKLNELLVNSMHETGGIRAYIYRYHNGLAAINSVPFFFQSNTHEVISPGTSRLLAYEQRIPASFNIAVNNQFINNSCAIVLDTDKDMDSQNYYYFQSRQAKAFARCPIFMPNGDLFGFVGIDFSENPKDSKKIEEFLTDIAEKMGGIFSSITETQKAN